METLSRAHEMMVSRSPEDFLDSLADVGDEATWRDEDFSCGPLRDPLRAVPASPLPGPARDRPDAPRRSARGLYRA